MSNRNGSGQIVSARAVLEQRRESFFEVLPKTGIEPHRFFRLAVYASQTPALDGCEPMSVAKSVYAAAALGLSLDPSLGHAYIVPRKVKDRDGNYRKVAQFQPGYRGLIELATRSGRIAQVHVEVVDLADEFLVEKGTSRRIVHKPLVEMGMVQAKGIAAAYVTWKDTTTGTIEFHIIGKTRVDRARAASQTAGKGFSPWASDEAAMWMKTAVHDVKKIWSLSPEQNEAFNKAIQLDIAQATGQQQAVDEPGGEPATDEPEEITSLDQLDEPETSEGGQSAGTGEVSVIRETPPVKQSPTPADPRDEQKTEQQSPPADTDGGGPDVSTWDKFRDFATDIAADPDKPVQPAVFNAAMDKLKLTDAGSARSKTGAPARQAIAAAMLVGKFDWATATTKA